MAATRFKFVSPGVFVNEIDNSQLSAIPFGVGPTVIGRFERGPAMRPVRVSSIGELTEIFGNPVAGRKGGDVWRDGNKLGPTYAAYAAQAWLANNSSINVVRLLGTQHSSVSNGDAGSAGWQTDASNPATGGGAYGLFLANSASAGTAVNGTLAAVWYLNEGSMALSGTRAGTVSTTTSGSNVLLKSQGENSEFKAEIYNSAGTKVETISFNFNTDSAKYIRKVFNTTPALTNNVVTRTANVKTYWLGESFTRAHDEYVTNTTTGEVYGFIAPLASGSSYGAIHRRPMAPAKTGYVIGQDLSTDYASYNIGSMPKLFRISALDSGEWESKNLKIAIEDIKAPKNSYEAYGTFSLSIRLAYDTDATPQVLERFNGLTLDPNSANYVARRIGDVHIAWSDSEKRYKEYGNFANQSKYIYVEMEQEVDQGLTDPLLLPFGFHGPAVFNAFVVNSGSAVPTTSFANRSALRATNVTPMVDVGTLDFTGSFRFPTVALRVSASDAGLSQPTRAYFGFDTSKKNYRSLIDKSYQDVLLPPPSMYSNYIANEANRTTSFIFSLDDVVPSSTGAYWLSGSRVNNLSYTAISSSVEGANGGYAAVLAAGYDQFVMPLYGGADGLDITEAEPFRNNLIDSTKTDLNSSVYYTLRRSVDTVADPERVVTDIITIPGVTATQITDHVLATCESRGDALAIIDLPNAYIPETESTASIADRTATTVSTIVSDLRARAINNSYGATYYPWVQIRDTISNQNVWVPPSVVALGALSYGQSAQELWFAPAGFTRGGLSSGNAGLPVLSVSAKLSASERDDLYEANINPIASFPAEGIVIFGQKTLQVTPSALDRINVRRLMIYLKREISIIASTLLFDQNVQTTWDRFKAQVEPLLASVKSRLGLTDYKVVLDASTTTPDLVDRNILYAKVFLKPARAIEFIVIDFNITRSGASFAD